MTNVNTMGCGTCSNENAIKATFFKYQNKLRNGKDFSSKDMASCMLNESPGSPNLSILSFHGMKIWK